MKFSLKCRSSSTCRYTNVQLESIPKAKFSMNLILPRRPTSSTTPNQDASAGFGVKVAGKKTFILRRKVDGKSMTAKVGGQRGRVRLLAGLTLPD